ncbi:MAG TPA: hypothetical protein VI796_04310 [Candidatus Thermoplasmatota archaeon]|nr:hypothetical protein [Candidatus Thermoplasmatota archaeon]
MGAVLLVTSDLLWLGKVRAVADPLGVEVRVPERKSEVTHHLLDHDTALVLVDLHDRRYDFIETLRLVRGTRWNVRVVAFGAHTDTARFERAKQEGAEVITRGEMERRLPELLAPLGQS